MKSRLTYVPLLLSVSTVPLSALRMTEAKFSLSHPPPHTTTTSLPKFPLQYGLKRRRHYVTIQHYCLCCASMELRENCFCMFSTNSIVFCTEWFYSTAHCLQEKPHQSHGTAGEIWGFNPSYNRGRKVFQLLTKQSFSYTFLFLSPILCPLHSSY